MENKILLTENQWCEIDEKSLMVARKFELMIGIIEELSASVADKVLQDKIHLLKELASLGYKEACKFNHELLNLFDY